MLTHPKTKSTRRLESVRHDINRYVKRERGKPLPEGVDYWGFDCRFGDTEDETKVVHVSDIKACLDDAVKRRLTSFYVEILVKEGHRPRA